MCVTYVLSMRAIDLNSQLIVDEGEQYSVHVQVGSLSVLTARFNVIEGPIRPSSTGGYDNTTSTSVGSYVLFIISPLVIIGIICICARRYRHHIAALSHKREADISPLVQQIPSTPTSRYQLVDPTNNTAISSQPLSLSANISEHVHIRSDDDTAIMQQLHHDATELTPI